MLHDTVLVHLPIEQRQYSDPRYTAWVSGYRPQLDSIQIYQQTQYITKEVKVATKPKRWGIGLQAGYGVSLHNGQLFPAPYIGVGLSYSIVNLWFKTSVRPSTILEKRMAKLQRPRFRETCSLSTEAKIRWRITGQTVQNAVQNQQKNGIWVRYIEDNWLHLHSGFVTNIVTY